MTFTDQIKGLNYSERRTKCENQLTMHFVTGKLERCQYSVQASKFLFTNVICWTQTVFGSELVMDVKYV